jgi:hypothetical protein
MITIPFSVFFFVMLIMVISLIGWIHSTTKSFSRCMEFYVKGETAGYSRGCRTTVQQMRQLYGKAGIAWKVKVSKKRKPTKKGRRK